MALMKKDFYYESGFADLVLTFLVLLLLDAIFISLIYKWFSGMVKDIQHGEEMKIRSMPAFLVYPLLAIVLYVFVIREAKGRNIADIDIYLKAGLLGLAIYGTYDLTNLATLKGWRWQFSVVDMLWGVVGFVLTTLITLFLIRSVEKM
tara:strand:- start:453 stop:896 length:444 start_codon:yes stop_codon:yes gene_type:complete